MTQTAILQELRDALLAKLTERGEPRPFDTLFENDFLPLWQPSARSATRPISVRTRCCQCGRELRHFPFNIKNIICKDCYERDRRKHSASAPVKQQFDMTSGCELSILQEGLRDALSQNDRFANFGDLWFVASACPPLTQAHIAAITAHLTAHPDGTTDDELLTLIPGYAAGATDAVRRFALNYRLLSVDAVHCISRAPSGKWMLRKRYEAERKRFAPLKVRTPRGSNILSPDELKPLWIEGKLDKALEDEAEQENETSSQADQYRRSDKLTLTLSFGEWAQGSIHLTDAEAAFFRCDADEELTFADMTTGETFTVRFYRRRNDEREDNLLCSDALNKWIHGNCLIPAAYVDLHRTENPRQFGIGWRRVEKTLTYRRREWNVAENRIERFTDTFTV
jgi:hypothetical protein